MKTRIGFSVLSASSIRNCVVISRVDFGSIGPKMRMERDFFMNSLGPAGLFVGPARVGDGALRAPHGTSPRRARRESADPAGAAPAARHPAAGFTRARRRSV